MKTIDEIRKDLSAAKGHKLTITGAQMGLPPMLAHVSVPCELGEGCLHCGASALSGPMNLEYSAIPEALMRELHKLIPQHTIVVHPGVRVNDTPPNAGDRDVVHTDERVHFLYKGLWLSVPRHPAAIPPSQWVIAQGHDIPIGVECAFVDAQTGAPKPLRVGESGFGVRGFVLESATALKGVVNDTTRMPLNDVAMVISVVRGLRKNPAGGIVSLV